MTLTFSPDESTGLRASAQTISPSFLKGPNGARYIYCQSINWDCISEWFRYGTLQRFPEYAQPGALPWLGRDKGLFRGLSESDSSYASRLAKSKTTWKLAGNAPTLLQELFATLSPSGYTKIRYVVNGIDSTGATYTDWWTIDATGLSYLRSDNWDWDGSGGGTRFWLIFYTEDFAAPPAWGSAGAWGSGGIWGAASSFDKRPIVDAYALIDKFKCAGSHAGTWPRMDGGIIITNPTDPGGNWPGEPFDPTLPPGLPLPDGTYDDPKTPGRVDDTSSVYLYGL